MLPQRRPARFVFSFVLAMGCFLDCCFLDVGVAPLFAATGDVDASAESADNPRTTPPVPSVGRTIVGNDAASRSAPRRVAKGPRTSLPEGRPKSAVHALAATAAPNKPATPAVAAVAASNDSPPRIPSGSSVTTIDAAGRSIDLFTYKPDNYDGQRFILVFHGMLRNADEYRDHAIEMGKRYKALIVAPRFSSDQFSSACYQQGGLRVDGQIQPKDQWTWQLIPNMVAQVRSLESRPNMPFWMIGHSAGGQFLIRMAGFVDVGAERIVVANPGTYLLPSCRMDYPLGFGGLPEELAGDRALRRYLEQPITVYLGEGDTLRDDDLDTSPDADAQGLNRWQRGRGAFRCAQELARRNGWAFNWKLVTAPSVDHDHEKMFNHGRCDEAFNLADARPAAIVRSNRGSYRSSWAEMGNSRKAKRLL